LWAHPVNHFNVGCSFFEQGRNVPILQHRAIAYKLRRERAHTFFFAAENAHVNTPLPDTNASGRQLLSPT